MPLLKYNEKILNHLNELSDERCQILFGDIPRFSSWLHERGIKGDDPTSIFLNYIRNNKGYENLLESWESRIKITLEDLKHTKKDTKEIIVNHREDLANKYLGQYVSCSNLPNHINLLEDKQIKIIKKGTSAILIHEGNAVGAVIRDVALGNVLKHFGSKMEATFKSHYPIKRGNEHPSSGTMTASGFRANRTNPPTNTYSYKNKNLGSHAIKICDYDASTLAKWLFENGGYYLPISISSYEEFKHNVELEDDDIIGAVFCTKNYQVAGHRDDDRSEWAIGYVYEEEPVKEGLFFYPEYGVAIELASNSLWIWLTQAVHGTANIESGTRYTAVISLTERTAKALEKQKGLNS